MKTHLLEIRQSFRAECTPVKGGPVTVERVQCGTRIEARVRAFVVDGVERADLHLRHGSYHAVPFRCFQFIDREPGDMDGFASPEE